MFLNPGHQEPDSEHITGSACGCCCCNVLTKPCQQRDASQTVSGTDGDGTGCDQVSINQIFFTGDRLEACKEYKNYVGMTYSTQIEILNTPPKLYPQIIFQKKTNLENPHIHIYYIYIYKI